MQDNWGFNAQTLQCILVPKGAEKKHINKYQKVLRLVDKYNTFTFYCVFLKVKKMQI